MVDSRSLNGLELLDALTRHDLRAEVYITSKRGEPGLPIDAVEFDAYGIALITPGALIADDLTDAEDARDMYLKTLRDVLTEAEKMLDALENEPPPPPIPAVEAMRESVDTILALIREAID